METAVGTTATAGQQTPRGRTRPEHVRTTPWHWALALAGSGAVVGAALAASPATGTPVPVPVHSTPRALAASAAPDPAATQLPLDCGPFPVKAALSVPVELGDGHPGTVVAAHCAAETGTPPDAVFLLGFGPGNHPTVLATLLTERENLTVSRLAVRSDGAITGHAQGYSSEDVPRFRPDISLDLTWTRKGGGWERAQTAAPIAQA